MSYIITRFLGNIIKYLFVTLAIRKTSGIQITKQRYFIFSILYASGYFVLNGDDIRIYIIQCIYTVIMLWGCWINNGISQRRVTLPFIIVFLCIYEVINIVNNILGVAMAWLIYPIFLNEGNGILLLIISLVLKIVLTYVCLVNISKIKKFLSSYEKGICFIYLLIICIKIPFLYTNIRDAFEWKVIFLTIICCTVIFLIISKNEKHNAAKEMARIEENNKILSTKLHKSREILPAMVQVLSNVTENNGVEMEQQEAHKLLQEVNDLYGQQLKENNKEDLQLKSFCSTGLKVLDQQLSIYQREAIDKNINFDIYVQAPINELLKRDDIDQLKLQRAVGDLVRNAFRSVEREDKKCHAKGQVLLIIGCRCEEILEVNVVDNGAEFPLYVIEAFGKRGITTGGTGNGLADLVEFAKEIKASICLDEFEGRASSFTKKISVIFDKQGINYFNSARKELVTAPFWNTI